ncbi:MAG: glutamyl-tRNA reductase [Gemmatimonadota bacterium]
MAGFSRRSVPLDIRERLAPDENGVRALLDELRHIGSHGFVLTTCHRLELYWWGEADGEGVLRRWIDARHIGSMVPLTRRQADTAVRHLFAVTAGLDSEVLGEQEVQGQVRRAWRLAQAHGATNPELDELVVAALGCGRRVRRAAGFLAATDSVARRAVMAVLRPGGTRVEARCLVVGAGEVGRGVVDALRAAGAPHVEIVNRTSATGRTLAESREATWTPWEKLDDALRRADVVFVTTAAPAPVLHASRVAAAVAGGHALTVIDLAMPRNVDPDCRHVPGITLIDLDALGRQAVGADQVPPAMLEAAERTLQDELARYSATLNGRAAAARLTELHQLGRRVAEEELQRTLAELGRLKADEVELLRAMADRVARRILYPASRALRGA